MNQDFDTWRRRDLSDHKIVYLFLDGQYHAARQGTDEKEGVLSAYALLEPQPGPHAALEALWRDRPQVVPLQYALADGCGERPLYVLADACKSLHPFPDQIASFSRSHVEEAP